MRPVVWYWWPRAIEVLYERAIGLADLATKKPLTTASQLRIGSVTKQFTGVAILQLAEQGKLKVTDEIQKYVDFPRKEHPVTIEHLLTHTSGIPNFTDLPLYHAEAYAKEATLPELIAYFKDLPLEFEPGTKWSYSNSGYILLTAIVERASGMSWTDYVAEHLLRPAGMAESSASLASAMLPNEPGLGYQPEGDGWIPASPVSLTWPRGAGAIAAPWATCGSGTRRYTRALCFHPPCAKRPSRTTGWRMARFPITATAGCS